MSSGILEQLSAGHGSGGEEEEELKAAGEVAFEYWAGNPAVEITHGEIVALAASSARHRSEAEAGEAQEEEPTILEEDTSKMLASGSAVLASGVPCYMSAPELCDFLGAFTDETSRLFRHCRVLHGQNPDEYLIAIWLVSAGAASDLIRQYGGRRYNALEEARCRLHRILRCERSTLKADDPASPLLARTRSASPPPGLPGKGLRSKLSLSPAPIRRLSAPSVAAHGGAVPFDPSQQLPPSMVSPQRSPALSPLAVPQALSRSRSAHGASAPSTSGSPAAGAALPLPIDRTAEMLPCGVEELFSGAEARGSSPTPALAHTSGGMMVTGGAGSGPGTGNGEGEPYQEEHAFCPVCQEQIDSDPSEYQLTALGGGVPLTILCGHTFHARCLSRWCDATCPVCRFQQHPNQTSCCDICGQVEWLHICLVCGFIGCAIIQGEGHAQDHFEQTSHTYALEVNTQRVWDYAGNGYVHRLLYNDQDGKMVEHSVPDGEGPEAAASQLSALAEGEADGEGSSFLALAAAVEEVAGAAAAAVQGSHSAAAAAAAEAVADSGAQGLSGLARHEPSAPLAGKTQKKQESIVSEFNYLLASQLTAQRRYFEERQLEQGELQRAKLQAAQARLADAVSETERLRQRFTEANTANAALEAELAELAQEEEVLHRQRRSLEALNGRISGEQQKFEDARQGVKEQRRAAAQLRSQERQREVEELQQQIKDLELFVQMRRRCEASADAAELQSSHLLVTEAEPIHGRGRHGRRRAGRR